MAENGIYEVLWPRGSRVAPITPFSKRLETLNGKTVGELWNYAFRGKEIFSALEKGLSERYPKVKFRSWASFPNDGDHSLPDWEAHPELLSNMGCDAVIVGMGC
jgi:hypothetical protein